MTALGLFLTKKFVNKAELSRKTGIHTNRLGKLTLNEDSHLRAKELYLIALAMDIEPGELLQLIYKDTKLPKTKAA